MRKSKLLIFLVIILIMCICVSGFKSIVYPYNCDSIYVYNITDDKVEIAKNEKKRRMPASLAKIMTVYVGLMKIKNLNKIAPIDKQCYAELIKDNSSMAGYVGGEKTTFRDLLYGAMLASGGECAESIAINLYGNKDDFINEMNKQAKLWNLNNTFFTSTTGLDSEEQYTSAEDIGIIIKNALKDANFNAIFTKKQYVSTHTLKHPKGIVVQSTIFNKLKNYNQDGFEILGGKSGTTYGAGLCWATLATKDDKEYIIVVMGADFENIKDTGEGQIKDTIRILNEL